MKYLKSQIEGLFLVKFSKNSISRRYHTHDKKVLKGLHNIIHETY